MFSLPIFTLTGPKTFTSKFYFQSIYFGGLDNNRNSITYCPGCPDNFYVDGSGIVRVNAIPYPGFPGYLQLTPGPLVFTTPEPGTLSLFALGLAGVGFMRRRKAIVR
jgi:hypothetical protein